MNTYKKIIRTALIIFLGLYIGACTDLTEEPYTQLSSTNFNNNKDQVDASVKGIYAKLAYLYQWGHSFLFQEVPTDIGIIPTRGGGWNSSGERSMHEQTWDALTPFLKQRYQFYMQVIGTANFVLENINDAETFKEQIAEARFYRSMVYYDLIDYFGNVPIVTVSVQDPNKLEGNQPIAEQRAKVFNFIEQELIAAIADLPAKSKVPGNYYPRATKETAQALLAKLYLNAEVWSGSPRWNDCIEQCNAVINSGAFELTQKITDSFVPYNENSPEIIFSSVKTNLTQSYDGLWYYMWQFQAELAWKYHMPVSGWGGNSVLEDHYNSYDDDDFRKSLILAGPQFLDDGTPLYIGANHNGNGDPANGQFIIYPISNIADAPTNQGYKSAKYQPDVTQVGRSANNDLVILRYADILLSKAEAILRGGNDPMGQSAAELLNQVRARNFEPDKPISSPTLDDILNERAWEFSMEGKRRQDLIRFGKFTTLDYKYRVNFDEYRKIYPIPQVELDKNPNLVQNPGYTN